MYKLVDLLSLISRLLWVSWLVKYWHTGLVAITAGRPKASACDDLTIRLNVSQIAPLKKKIKNRLADADSFHMNLICKKHGWISAGFLQKCCIVTVKRWSRTALQLSILRVRMFVYGALKQQRSEISTGNVKYVSNEKIHTVTYFTLYLQSVSTHSLLGSIYTVCSLYSVPLHPEGWEQLFLPLAPALLLLLFQ